MTDAAADNQLPFERAGSFVLETSLGEGAMGSIFLARHSTLGMKAAIKVLKPGLAHSEELVQRFMNEARSISSIDHPGLPRMLDFGRLPSGQLYSVMEHLDGVDLDAHLRDHQRLSSDCVIEIVKQIVRTLTVVHQHGIIHRDLKPANVFLTRNSAGEQRVVVLDFGIAKLREQADHGRLTQAGIVLGSPDYIAPEQARGFATVDHRADIYSLGCMMYEMLAGRPVFTTDTIPDLLRAHMSEQPQPLISVVGHIAPALDTLVMRCLAKDPDQRWQTMGELSEALDALPARNGPWLEPAHPVQHLPIQSRPSATESARVPTRPHRPRPPAKATRRPVAMRHTCFDLVAVSVTTAALLVVAWVIAQAC